MRMQQLERELAPLLQTRNALHRGRIRNLAHDHLSCLCLSAAVLEAIWTSAGSARSARMLPGASAHMTAYGTFNHNLTLVGISRTYCHAAEWSAEMSPKKAENRRLEPVMPASDTSYIPASTSVLPAQLQCPRHMAEARSNARHICTTQERPTSHPGSTQCTVCSARSKHPAAARGLAAALEINGELPAMNGGQVGGEGLIVVRGAAALGGDAKHFVWTNCYSLPTTCATPLR